MEKAIDWCLAELKKDGFVNVHGEDVMVPRWVRGKESAVMVSPRRRVLPMLGLGGSVGTPVEGITAEVLVVDSFADLKVKAARAKGKMVLFNLPFTNYRETVIVRSVGAIEAAKVGAVASLIRSVGPFSMQTPHTGNMRYDDKVKRIPHAALSVEDALMLARMQSRGETIRVRLKMEARTLLRSGAGARRLGWLMRLRRLGWRLWLGSCLWLMRLRRLGWRLWLRCRWRRSGRPEVLGRWVGVPRRWLR